MPPKLEASHEVLLDILKWMDAHDDVLPKRHTKPTPTQKEETALKLKYDDYIVRSTALAKEQRTLQQEINRRKTDRPDVDTISDVAEWSERHNGRLPVLSKNDEEQKSLAQRLRYIESKDPKSLMLHRRLAQLQEKAHQTPTKVSQRGAKVRDTKRAASAFIQA